MHRIRWRWRVSTLEQSPYVMSRFLTWMTLTDLSMLVRRVRLAITLSG